MYNNQNDLQQNGEKEMKAKKAIRRTASLITVVLLSAVLMITAFPSSRTAYADSTEMYVYFGSYIQNKITDPYEYDYIDSSRYKDTDLFKDGKAVIKGVKVAERDGNYYKEAPIRWKVVKSSGSTYVLLSEKVLAYRDFGWEGTWGDSALRKWLNEDFLNDAFTKDEQGAILPVNVPFRNKTYEDWCSGQFKQKILQG